MYVLKRDGRQECLHLGKFSARLKKLSYALDIEHCDPVLVAQKVCAGLCNGVTTDQLDGLAAETAAAMSVNYHSDYALLAARIAVSNLHKNTRKTFSATVKEIHSHYSKRTEPDAPLDEIYDIIIKNASQLDSEIVYDRDYDYDYLGFKTLERSYLLKIGDKVAERPQHMLMRVSVGIHKNDIESAIRTYHLISQPWFCHASPTLFNAGNPKPLVGNAHTCKKEGADNSKLACRIGASEHNICAVGNPDHHSQVKLDLLVEQYNDTYTWKIDDITGLKEMHSPVFTIKGFDWKLLLSLEGGNLSILLSPNDYRNVLGNAKLATKFEICLKNQLKSKDMKKSASVTFSNPGNSGLGFPAFIFVKELDDPSAGFKVDDSVIIQVTIESAVLVSESVSVFHSI